MHSLQTQLFDNNGNFVPTNFKPEGFTVNTTQDLLFAEEMLDAMDAGFASRVHYSALHRSAEAYVLSTGEWRTKPWLRTGGAVYDIIAELTSAVAPSHDLCAFPLDGTYH